jgi:hypothetical protein
MSISNVEGRGGAGQEHHCNGQHTVSTKPLNGTQQGPDEPGTNLGAGRPIAGGTPGVARGGCPKTQSSCTTTPLRRCNTYRRHAAEVKGTCNNVSNIVALIDHVRARAGRRDPCWDSTDSAGVTPADILCCAIRHPSSSRKPCRSTT